MINRFEKLDPDIPFADQTWSAHGNPAIVGSCVVEVPGVGDQLLKRDTDPSRYQGRTVIVTGPKQVSVLNDKAAQAAQSAQQYHRELGFNPGPIVGVRSLPGKSIEENIIAAGKETGDAVRRSLNGAWEREKDGLIYYPYSGSKPATKAAKVMGADITMDADIARRGNDKAYLIELCEDRDIQPWIAQTFAANNYDQAEQAWEKHFKEDEKAIIKPRFGAAGMDLVTISSLSELEAYFEKATLESKQDGFVIQRFVPGATASPSINIWIKPNGQGQHTAFKLTWTDQELKGTEHIGNFTSEDRFVKYPGMEQGFVKIVNQLIALGVQGPVGFDLVEGVNPDGTPVCKVVEMNQRHTGAGPITAQHHNIGVRRCQNGLNGQTPGWSGYFDAPHATTISDAVSRLDREGLRFDANTGLGPVVTMTAENGPDADRIYVCMVAPNEETLKAWRAAIKSLSTPLHH